MVIKLITCNGTISNQVDWNRITLVSCISSLVLTRKANHLAISLIASNMNMNLLTTYTSLYSLYISSVMIL